MKSTNLIATLTVEIEICGFLFLEIILIDDKNNMNFKINLIFEMNIY